GEATGNYFAEEANPAGDVNGDGYSDFIIGAYRYSSNTGRAYLYYGGSAVNNTVDVVYTGPSASSSFAKSVRYAGDVNGDGYDDVIIGASQINSNDGRAYIFYGSNSLSSSISAASANKT